MRITRELLEKHGVYCVPELMRAVRRRNIEIVEELLQNGADVNARNNRGETALMWAVYSRDVSMVELLLQNGADVTVTDQNGDTALIWAIYSGDVSMGEFVRNRMAVN